MSVLWSPVKGIGVVNFKETISDHFSDKVQMPVNSFFMHGVQDPHYLCRPVARLSAFRPHCCSLSLVSRSVPGTGHRLHHPHLVVGLQLARLFAEWTTVENQMCPRLLWNSKYSTCNIFLLGPEFGEIVDFRNLFQAMNFSQLPQTRASFLGQKSGLPSSKTKVLSCSSGQVMS